MAFNAGSIKAVLELDVSKFRSALNRVTGRLGPFGAGLRGIGRGLQRLNQLGGKAVVALGAAGLAGAIAGVTAALAKGSQAQADYELAVENLRGTLERAGVQGFDAVTAQIEKFATEMQQVSGISDTTTVRVSQTLAAMGVAAEDLPSAAEAVLDYSQAMGRDAVESAKQLGRSLSGLTGELGEALPAVRELTAEQLKQGAAFDIVRGQFGGLSRELGTTFSGRLNRLGAAFDDFLKKFGRALNDTLGPALTDLQRFFDFLAESIASGNEEFSLFEEVATRVGEVLSNLAQNIPTLVAGAVARFQELRSVMQTIIGVSAQIQGAIAGFVADVGGFLERILRNIGETLGKLPGIGDELQGAFAGMADSAQRFAQGARQAQGEFESVRDTAANTTRELRESADRAREAGSRVQGMADSFREAADQAEETSQNTERLPSTMQSAAVETQKFATAMERTSAAAASLVGDVSDAASAAGGFGGGGGGGGGGEGGGGGLATGGFHSGGSRRLNFSDPFAALQEVQSAREGLNYTPRAGVAGFQAAVTGRFYRDVLREAQAVQSRAVRDLTGDILQELNSRGVLDPQERQRIVRQRIDEAERLGIIPESGRFGALGGGAALF